MKIIILPLFITFVFLVPHVKADAALINSVCAKTTFPKDCHDCFANNTGSTQMTVRELAGAALYCTFHLSETIQQGGAANGICKVEIANLISDLSGAMAFWNSYDADSTKKEYDSAKKDYQTCKKKISKSGSPLPSVFVTVGNLLDDSIAIILQSLGS